MERIFVEVEDREAGSFKVSMIGDLSISEIVFDDPVYCPLLAMACGWIGGRNSYEKAQEFLLQACPQEAKGDKAERVWAGLEANHTVFMKDRQADFLFVHCLNISGVGLEPDALRIELDPQFVKAVIDRIDMLKIFSEQDEGMDLQEFRIGAGDSIFSQGKICFVSDASEDEPIAVLRQRRRLVCRLAGKPLDLPLRGKIVQDSLQIISPPTLEQGEIVTLQISRQLLEAFLPKP